MVALVLVAVAGATAVTLAAHSAHAVTAARAADEELRRASALLDAVTLWSNEDLARHLGDRPEGPRGRWTLRVLRTAPTIFTIALFTSPDGSDPATPRRLLLSTALYRRMAR
jgi:hypothetical protein